MLDERPALSTPRSKRRSASARRGRSATTLTLGLSPVLAALLLVAHPTLHAAASGLGPVNVGSCLSDASIEATAAQFRRVRPIPGQFSGGAWNSEVDQWMGPKHRLMLALGTRLGEAECRKDQLSAVLGPPDGIARDGDAWFAQAAAQAGYAEPTPSSQEFLVYYWRGIHDFLFFVSREGVIVGSDWWYAGE